MILTIILLGTCILGGASFVGRRKYQKIMIKKNFERLYSVRNLLTDAAYKELKRHIIEDCKGYFYADALIKEVINQGYRFTCKQIYELRTIYTQKQQGSGWLGNKVNADEYVNKLTQYEHALKVDAQEKIFNLLYEPNKTLLLTD